MTKPTKEQLRVLDELTTKACLGSAPLLRRSDGDALEALLDDYRARGEALRKIRDAWRAKHEADSTIALSYYSALEGAGDEHD